MGGALSKVVKFTGSNRVMTVSKLKNKGLQALPRWGLEAQAISSYHDPGPGEVLDVAGLLQWGGARFPP